MKTVYHLHLNAVSNSDKFFAQSDPGFMDANHKDPRDVDGGWKHCSEDVETLAQFVHDIIQVGECGQHKANRLIITRYSLPNAQDVKWGHNPKMLGWNWRWDADEKELEFINQGFTHTKKDRNTLVRFIVKSCDKEWKHWDKRQKAATKSLLKFEKRNKGK